MNTSLTPPGSSKRNWFLSPWVLGTALWLLLVVIFFWPVFFQGKVLAPLDILDSLLRPWATTETISVHNAFTYDAISQYLPYDWSVYQSLRQDGYIGWNPYTHSGNSIVENTMICPGDWRHQLYRFLPFWDAWNTGILLQFALAGLGMLVLLRSQGIPAPYAMPGVVAYGFYSQFILWIYHRWVLGAMCWAPWIVWSLLRARKKGRTIDPWSGIFIGLAFRGGHLQACIFIVLLVMSLAFAEWWKHPERRKFENMLATFTPYAIAGGIGTLLASDVFLHTIPPLLHGGKGMPHRSWLDGIRALPSLVTCALPTALGTPQGLDAFKGFGLGLFDIKFLGGTLFLLSALGLIRKTAPFSAKVLFAVGLILPFTPADRWVYSRFTTVFALGAAWLACWYLHSMSSEASSRRWRQWLTGLGCLALAWFMVSILLVVLHDGLESRVHALVHSVLPRDKPDRQAWMLARASYFLRTLRVWHPRNLGMLGLIAAGLWACTRIHRDNRNAPAYAVGVAMLTFGEIVLFSTTWVTFSDRPAGDVLYKEPAWVEEFRNEMENGTVFLLDRSNFDYMQLNTPSAHGIRFAEGYETVTPKRILWPADPDFHPEAWAAAGVSHVLAPPGTEQERIPGWDVVLDNEALVLFRNPAFESIYRATTLSGSNRSIQTLRTTPNTREFSIPAGTHTVDILESYHPGWRYSIDDQPWKPVAPTAIQAMRITLDSPTDTTSTLVLRYRPTYYSWLR